MSKGHQYEIILTVVVSTSLRDLSRGIAKYLEV